MKNMKYISFFAQAFGFLLIALGFAIPELAEVLGMTGTGVVFAAVPIAGGTASVGTIEKQDPEYLAEDISQLVTRIDPNNYAFDTLMRHLGNDKEARNMRIQFEEFEYHKRDGLITAIDAVVGTGNEHKAVLTLAGNMDRFGREETIMIPEVEVEVDGRMQELVVKVLDRDSTAKTLTVQVLYQDDSTGDYMAWPGGITVGDGIPAFRIAPNVSEMTAQVVPKGLIPVREWNYAQILMATISQSKLMRRMRAKSGHKTYAENQLQAIKDFRSSCEYAIKFGVRATGYDEDGEQWWNMNGFTRYVDKQINYTKGAMTENDFIDWTRNVFATNNGSKTRHLLADSYLVSDILKVPSVQKQLDASKVDVVRGIRCTKIESNFGMLLITHDSSLDELDYKHYGIVVDPKNVRRRVVEPMQITDLEVDKPGLKRADMKRLLENFTVEVRHKDTHAIVRGLDPEPEGE